MKEIKYDKSVILFLEELVDVLIKEEYFSFYDTSENYMWDLIQYVKLNIHISPHKPAPDYFTRFGENLFYIHYNRNKNTTWYIFFEKTKKHYFIKHISNNHVVGKFLE